MKRNYVKQLNSLAKLCPGGGCMAIVWKDQIPETILRELGNLQENWLTEPSQGFKFFLGKTLEDCTIEGISYYGGGNHRRLMLDGWTKRIDNKPEFVQDWVLSTAVEQMTALIGQSLLKKLIEGDIYEITRMMSVLSIIKEEI